MRHLDPSIDGSDLVDGFDFGTEATMDAKDLAINDGSNGEVVKDLGAVLPGVGVAVLSVDFIIEAIDSGDLSG